eukprot:scaffold6182_cov164-Ochromonas_danica.AAC.2
MSLIQQVSNYSYLISRSRKSALVVTERNNSHDGNGVLVESAQHTALRRTCQQVSSTSMAKEPAVCRLSARVDASGWNNQADPSANCHLAALKALLKADLWADRSTRLNCVKPWCEIEADKLVHNVIIEEGIVELEMAKRNSVKPKKNSVLQEDLKKAEVFSFNEAV